MLDLEPIKFRLSRVPAPPWGEFCESGDWWIQQQDAEGEPIGETICDSGIDAMKQEIADFIADSPGDIHALIGEVERLRTALSDLIWGCENGDMRPSPAFDDARRALGTADPLRLICGPVGEED
jgi:hypothetical protein